MSTLEDRASAYEEATDGCRHLVLATRDNAPHWQRVKPDLETHLEAEFEREENFLRFSFFDLVPLPPPRNEVCPRDPLDEPSVAKFV